MKILCNLPQPRFVTRNNFQGTCYTKVLGRAVTDDLQSFVSPLEAVIGIVLAVVRFESRIDFDALEA